MDLKEYLEIQRQEIDRHKWIESEKAGKDLGMDAAIDWILRYADAFSDQFACRLRAGMGPTGENSQG